MQGFKIYIFAVEGQKWNAIMEQIRRFRRQCGMGLEFAETSKETLSSIEGSLKVVVWSGSIKKFAAIGPFLCDKKLSPLNIEIYIFSNVYSIFSNFTNILNRLNRVRVSSSNEHNDAWFESSNNGEFIFAPCVNTSARISKSSAPVMIYAYANRIGGVSKACSIRLVFFFSETMSKITS